jgi:hypothetical protein
MPCARGALKRQGATAKDGSSPPMRAALSAGSPPVRPIKAIPTGDSLKALLGHEGSAENRHLLDNLTSAERGARSILHAMFMAGCLFVLSLSALVYCAVLLPDLVFDRVHFLTKSLSLVCVASFISGLEFVGYGFWHRLSLNRLHRECHRLLPPLVESQLIPAQAIEREVPHGVSYFHFSHPP